MKHKGRDYSQLLIWAALAVTVTRYVGAFVASDVGEITGMWSSVLTALMAVSGIGMGILDVIGLAYVFDGWRRVLPAAGARWSSRFKVLTGFVVGLFVVGLAILTPFTVSRIASLGMYDALGAVGGWLWSLAVNLAPILLIGGVMFSQSGIVGIKQSADASHSDANATHKNGSAHICTQCGESFAKSTSLANHVRWSHPAPERANGHTRGEG